jgi:hypothetical protein
MRHFIAVVSVLCFLLLTSCAQKETAGPHATVEMKDGTELTGTVTASSPAEITLQGDDKNVHTIAMAQVRSIEYDDAPAPATASTPASQPSTPEQPVASAPKALPAKRATAHRDHYHPPQSAVNTKSYLLPVGTEIPIRAEETIDSSKSSEGQTYAAEVAADVRDAEGAVVIPEGSNAKILIKSVSQGGRIVGASDLVLDLRAVSVEGQEYLIGTSDLKKGKDGVGANKRTAIFTGGGAAVGAIIGAIAGGGKGAAIGAASGAGAGAVTQIVTKGGSIKVPAETILTFKLDRSLQVDASK